MQPVICATHSKAKKNPLVGMKLEIYHKSELTSRLVRWGGGNFGGRPDSGDLMFDVAGSNESGRADRTVGPGDYLAPSRVRWGF